MTATILITGFGPFPGAPFNPTEPLVMALARRRHPFANVRRVGACLPRELRGGRPRVAGAARAGEAATSLLMFGLAARTKHLRIETRARNALTRLLPDAGGHVPASATIAPEAPADAAAARSGATAGHGGASSRRAGRALPRRRRAISATICAGGPPRPRVPTAAAHRIHPCADRAPQPDASAIAPARRSRSMI